MPALEVYRLYYMWRHVRTVGPLHLVEETRFIRGLLQYLNNTLSVHQKSAVQFGKTDISRMNYNNTHP